jgi:threonine/homoserine/homoserine lactone efflux protein
MNPALFAGFLVFAFVSSVTPGPNNLMMMASGVNYGVRRTLPHMAGVCLGFGAMTLAIGLGLAGIFGALPWLYVVLRWGAAAYILYLAYKMATARGVGNAVTGARPMTFLQAVAFQWVNPKAWVMALGAVTTYAEPGRLTADVALIAATFVVINIPCGLAWTVSGVAIKRFLKQGRTLRVFNIVMAALLVASLYPLFTEALGAASKPLHRPPPGVIIGAPRSTG